MAYMLAQNRPYSVSDVASNFHKEHGKVGVGKAMDRLVSERRLKQKINGKQKVYLFNQNELSAASPDELGTMDHQILGLEKSLKDGETRYRQLHAKLRELSSTLTTEELKSQVALLQKEMGEGKAKYKALSQSPLVVDPQARNASRDKLKDFVLQWRRRRTIAMSLIAPILENSTLPKNHLLTEMKIETDEEAGVWLPRV